MLGCRFFPLHGVTTVHCEVARQVAEPYRDLHLFPTTPPPGVDLLQRRQGEHLRGDPGKCRRRHPRPGAEGIDLPGGDRGRLRRRGPPLPGDGTGQLLQPDDRPHPRGTPPSGPLGLLSRAGSGSCGPAPPRPASSPNGCRSISRRSLPAPPTGSSLRRGAGTGDRSGSGSAGSRFSPPSRPHAARL